MAAGFDELFREGAMLDNAAVTVQSKGLSLGDLRKACLVGGGQASEWK